MLSYIAPLWQGHCDTIAMLATTEPLGLQRSAVRPLSEGLRGYLMNLYSSVVLNLYAVILYFSLSLSFLTFHRVKSNKSARHRQNKAQQPFARAVLASTRSAVVCRSLLIVQALGAKELAFHALTATRKTPLKHHLPFSRCLNGCSLLFRQCRIFF